MSVNKKEVDLFLKEKSIVDRVVDHVCTPIYQPTNEQWEITFKTLGWDRKTIEDFWAIFCRINKSRTGEISIFEFLNYFNLDRSEYVEKCFDYFDTTGGSSVDFLEFMVSVWNICTMKVDTLTKFTFDIYDLDSDGQLSLPEIELMVLELYGKNKILSKIGNDVLQDLNRFAEERGGMLNLTSFIIYTMNHSLLLFPIFKIQRTIQKKVMGVRYWVNIENDRMSHYKPKREFTPRHVQILLRTYKTGEAAAFLTHTGDPNVALRDHYIKGEKEDTNKTQFTAEETEDNATGNSKVVYKYGKLKSAVEKMQQVKWAKTAALTENAKSIRNKTVRIANEAFLEAGRKARKSYTNSRLNKIQGTLNDFVHDIREKLNEPEHKNPSKSQDDQISKVGMLSKAPLDNVTTVNSPDNNNNNLSKLEDVQKLKVYKGRLRKKKPPRPMSAPNYIASQKRNIMGTQKPNNIENQKRSIMGSQNSPRKKFDHRTTKFNKKLRPRNLGTVVHTIDQNGEYRNDQKIDEVEVPKKNALSNWHEN